MPIISGVAASLRAEIFKVGRRPATYLLCTIPLLNIALFGYLSFYLTTCRDLDGALTGPGSLSLWEGLAPTLLLSTWLFSLSRLGGATALIFGALYFGSEYTQDTLKLALTAGPSRVAMFFGKFLCTSLVMLALALASLSVAAASSYTVSRLEGLEITVTDWPSLSEQTLALVGAFLILMAWASLGLLLATLFRSNSLAIGLGLIYTLVVDTFLDNIDGVGSVPAIVQRTFVANSSEDLSDVFLNSGLSATVEPLDALTASTQGTSEPIQAAMVLGAYVIGSALIAGGVFCRRDVH